MTTIRRTLDFKASVTTDIHTRTIEYFKKSGFKYVDKLTDKKIRFERGSIASNLWTFNPLNWKSEIDIEINGDNVNANFTINATGQIPTNKDEMLWEIFIDNYVNYMNDSNFDFLTANSKALRVTKSKNLKYIGWAILGGLIGGIPAGLIAHWTGIDTIMFVGAGGGAISLLTKKINDDKKENVL